MMGQRFLACTAGVITLAGYATHLRPASADTPPTKPANVAPAEETADGVRSIRLPQMPINLPEAEGRNLVIANCMICHSPNYIMMQPPLSRKVWEASVDKMRKTFGAPVPESLVPQIVDYLVKVRGS